MRSISELLPPSALARLSNLSLIARWIVEGFISGLHKSPYHGFSIEFAEYRPYTAGDDLRHFDWKVLADSASEYKIWITIKGPSVRYPVYVTVTPRHLQRFSVTGSTGLYASSMDADGKVLEEKIIKNTGGLVSYEKFAVTSAAGNIFTISRKKRN